MWKSIDHRTSHRVKSALDSKLCWYIFVYLYSYKHHIATKEEYSRWLYIFSQHTQGFARRALSSNSLVYWYLVFVFCQLAQRQESLLYTYIYITTNNAIETLCPWLHRYWYKMQPMRLTQNILLLIWTAFPQTANHYQDRCWMTALFSFKEKIGKTVWMNISTILISYTQYGNKMISCHW